ncbi:MAG TPA: DUF1326 domain-containing protein [Gaiellaceae bacterium]|nr:DUF1326 domain-containing protein [Gaiellaceae bacterium]
MSWNIGGLIDAAASDEQAEQLGGVFSGALGEPMEARGPLVGENLGVERGKPAQLVGIFHPAGPDLTAAHARRSKIDAFGISFEGKAAFSHEFAWAA